MVNTHLGLYLSLKGDDIILGRGSDIPDEVWRDATDWWSNSALWTDSQNIALSITDFDAKKSWLRLVWDKSTYSVDFQRPEVPDALNNLQIEVAAFESRIANGVQPNDLEVAELQNDPQLLRIPTDDQARNVISLLSMKNGANFSVPGAGKTSTQFLLWYQLRKSNRADKMLVICPKSSFEAWETEPSKVFKFPVRVTTFGSTYSYFHSDILVANYEQLERPAKLTELKKWLRDSPATIVVDEAHRIKGGAKSVRWRAVKTLSALASRTDILTGTPMPQGPDDLRNLFSITWNKLPNNFLSDEKIAQIRPWSIFVRTTKDQLGLPPVTLEKVPIAMGPIQSDIYQALGKNYQGALALKSQDRAVLARKGRAVFTLIAAATNPGLLVRSTAPDAFLDLQWPPQDLSNSADLTAALHNYAKHELPPKYEWIARFVEASAQKNRKVLIWSTFVGNLLAIEKVLKAYNPAVVHGGVQGVDRAAEIKRFRVNPDCKVLISNPQTLGEGVSLHQECHDAVFMDRSFNASQYLQALDRIHRLGLSTDQDTRVYLLESAGTIDDQVDARLKRKIIKLGEFLNDAGLATSALPSDEDEFESSLDYLGMDEADLEAILNHLRKFNG